MKSMKLYLKVNVFEAFRIQNFDHICRAEGKKRSGINMVRSHVPFFTFDVCDRVDSREKKRSRNCHEIHESL